MNQDKLHEYKILLKIEKILKVKLNKKKTQ